MATAPAPARIRLPDRHSRCVGSRRRYIGCPRSCREATGTAGGDGVHQVDSAMAVEHDRFTGMGIDRRDEHRSLRPVLTGQPRGDGRAPPRLPGTVRRRIHVECRRAHSAAHVSRILGGGDDLARSLHVIRHRPDRNASSVGSDRTGPLLGRRGKDGGKQFGRGRASHLGRGRRSGRRPDDQISLGHIQPGIEQAGDDADQPRVACRSAATEDQRSLACDAHPLCGVDLRLIPVGPQLVGGRRRSVLLVTGVDQVIRERIGRGIVLRVGAARISTRIEVTVRVAGCRANQIIAGPAQMRPTAAQDPPGQPFPGLSATARPRAGEPIGTGAA